MESFINYKVTNADLFNSVGEVDLNLKSYERHFEGDVSIEINNGEGWKTFSGQHGANDYVDEYGFQIVKEYVRDDAEDKHWNDVSTYNERHS